MVFIRVHPLPFGDEKNSLSHLAYHFKELLKADCTVLVDTIPRRGTGHIYRSRVFHGDIRSAGLRVTSHAGVKPQGQS
jgi:hypothetical protein